MAREWLKLGHDVLVVAGSHSHLRQMNPDVTADLTEETVDGVPYIWLDTPVYSGNGRERVRNMLAFVRKLYRYRDDIVRLLPPDVVIASSTYPFDIFPARRIARRSGARLIFELHDLWPLSPIELGGFSRWHPFILATQFAEDYVCRHSDAIVSLLPKASEHLQARGMAPEKFHYVPNGVVLEDWKVEHRAALPAEHATTFEGEKARGRFVIVYAGAHGLLNNLGVIIDAAASLAGTAASFVLVGQGPDKPALEERARMAGLDNVHFLPPVPKASVPAVLAAADALILSFAPQPLFRFGVSPNKLMDYMMAGKPIIAAMRAGNNPVQEHDCGFTTPPDDPRALASCVSRLMALPAIERNAMGARGRAAVETVYSYDVLAKRFAQCF